MSCNYQFAGFSFSPERPLLTCNGTPVRVGSRALAILHLLIERHESLVTKREIFARVWPGADIGEESIRLNINLLRRALNDDQNEQRFILTDHGRGYRFVAAVTRVPQDETVATVAPLARGAGNLPVRLTSLVGRDQTIAQVAGYLAENRLLTLVGPGGIGKTSVAVAVARRASDDYPDGAWLVDLAPLENPHLIPVTLCSLLGVPRSRHDPLDNLAEFLRPRRLLLVLDNCERLVEESGQLARCILTAASGVQVLATSREALRVPAERLFQLPRLEAPPQNREGLSATVKRNYPAVRLFIERALTRVLADPIR